MSAVKAPPVWNRRTVNKPTTEKPATKRKTATQPQQAKQQPKG